MEVKNLHFDALTNDNYNHLSATVYFPGCNMQCCYCYNLKELNTSTALSTEEVKSRIKKLVKEVAPSLFNRRVDYIVFSGGECTLYPDQLKDLLEYSKSLGFKTMVFSNGTHPEVLDQLKSLVDYYSFDFKFWNHKINLKTFINYDGDLYFKQLKESLKVIKDIPYEFRTVLVKPYVLVEGLDYYEKFIKELDNKPKRIHVSNVLISNRCFRKLTASNGVSREELDKVYNKIKEFSTSSIFKHYFDF